MFHFRIRGCHPLWPVFPNRSANSPSGTGLVRVRSPLLTESRLMSFPPGTEMFQFPGFASPKPILFSLVIPFPFNSAPDCSGSKLNGEGGFPHSEIVGSKFAHNSPTLIAACHVLHRLCMPRHPPNALTSRLRVHTTNDSAGIERSKDRTPLGYAGAMMRIIQISAFILVTTIILIEIRTNAATASILRTHLQCESGGKSPNPHDP